MSTQSIDLYRLQVFKQLVSERNDESIKRLAVALLADAERFHDTVCKGNRQGWRLSEQIFYMQQTLEQLRRAVFEFDLSSEEVFRVAALIGKADSLAEEARGKAKRGAQK